MSFDSASCWRAAPAQARRPVLLLAALAAAGQLAHAQTPPPPTLDPAQIQRQLEELERRRPPGADTPVAPTAPQLSAPAPETPLLPSSSASFVLRAVDFSESRLLEREALEAAVAAQLGQPTTFSDIAAMLQRINALYASRGHLTARALVPSQRIEDGRLRITLVEGALAGVETPAATRMSPAYLERLIGLEPGEVIDVPAMASRLQRFHRGTDVRVAARFVPAEQAVGQSIVQLEVSEPPRWTGRVSLSNEGNDSVGTQQLSFSGTLNNLLGRSDRGALWLTRSKGATSVALQYGMPIGVHGTRAVLALSDGDTEVISGAYRTLELNGSARSASLLLNQPIAFWGPWGLDAGLSLGESRSETEISGQPFSDLRVRSHALAATLSRQTAASDLQVSLNLTDADSRADGLEARNARLAQLGLNWLWQLGPHWSLQSRLNLQRSDTVNLPSALQFQLGGPTTVRGYPSPAVSGDEGEVLALEAHRRFGERFSAFAFVDQGRALTEASPAARLGSVGLGLGWRLGAWSLQSTLASPRREVVPDQKGTQLLVRLSVDLEQLGR